MYTKYIIKERFFSEKKTLYEKLGLTKGTNLHLVFCHCHNAYQQCLPSSSVQIYRINIAKALWLWQEKQDTWPLLQWQYFFSSQIADSNFEKDYHCATISTNLWDYVLFCQGFSNCLNFGIKVIFFHPTTICISW